MSIVNEIDIWSYRYRRGPFRFRFCFGFISVYKAKVISSILSIYGRLLASIGVYRRLYLAFSLFGESSNYKVFDSFNLHWRLKKRYLFPDIIFQKYLLRVASSSACACASLICCNEDAACSDGLL